MEGFEPVCPQLYYRRGDGEEGATVACAGQRLVQEGAPAWSQATGTQGLCLPSVLMYSGCDLGFCLTSKF